MSEAQGASGPRRIAYIEQDAAIGGAQVNLLGLLTHLDRRRYEPVVLLPCDGPLRERLEALGVEWRLVPRARLRSTSRFVLGRKLFDPLAVCWNLALFAPASARLAAALREVGAELAQTGALLPHLYGSPAARLAGIPSLWHLQDIVSPTLAGGLPRAALLAAAALPLRVVAVSRACAQPMAARYAGKLRVVPNGVDVDRFAPAVSRKALRQRLGLSEQDLVLGLFGRLATWKGHEAVLRAVAVLAPELPQLRLLLVGGSPYSGERRRRELEDLVAKLRLQGTVRFLGNRNDMPELFGALDLLVHASLQPEPFGLVVVEAMACGVPVLASCLGGPAEIIRAGHDGALVDPREPQALCAALRDLLLDRALRNRLGIAARQTVMRRFQLQSHVAAMQRVYSEILEAWT